MGVTGVFGEPPPWNYWLLDLESCTTRHCDQLLRGAQYQYFAQNRTELKFNGSYPKSQIYFHYHHSIILSFIQAVWTIHLPLQTPIVGMNERGDPGQQESCVQVDINPNNLDMATHYSS
jgi:hypothetical protein